MRSAFLIVALLLFCLISYSQTEKLRHIDGNSYLFKTYHYNSRTLEKTLLENYNDLEKDEKGVVRTIVLNVKNDTLAILDNNADRILGEIHFKAGKRQGGMTRWLDVYHNTKL